MTADRQAASATERLAALCLREPDETALDRAALHYLDWLGCALIGRTVPEGRILAGGLDPGRWLDGGPDPAARAFAMGGLGSIFEMDDVHRRGLLHPGPVVMAAISAFGAQTPARRLLAAVLAGYEAMVGIGRSLGREHYRYFHPTSTLGGIGAAAAASVILGLDAARMVWAMGTAGSTAGGVFQCLHEPVMTKPYHISEAARRGVAAAILAEAGLTGPRFILEGPQGLFAATARDGDAASIAADPAAPWLIGEVSFKPWPACRHVHAVIDAALLLRKALGGREVARVAVETYADAVRICSRPEPRTMHDAKFSIEHAVAVVLASGKPGLADFEPANLDRAAWRALRGRVSVTAADRFSSVYPGRFGAAVTATLADGTTVSREVPDAWGDPENPMDREAVIAKAEMLIAASGYAPAPASRIAAAALSLATGGTLAALARELATAD